MISVEVPFVEGFQEEAELVMPIGAAEDVSVVHQVLSEEVLLADAGCVDLLHQEEDLCGALFLLEEEEE